MPQPSMLQYPIVVAKAEARSIALTHNKPSRVGILGRNFPGYSMGNMKQLPAKVVG